MDRVSAHIQIQASPAKVFDVFVNRVNEWWPLQGYSFAPEHTTPGQIHFVPEVGGRFYETFANGEEFQIGSVTVLQSPARFSFTWKGEAYKEATEVDVILIEVAGGTLLTLTHSGWAAAGVPEFAPSYAAGWPKLLALFAALAERE